MSAAPIANRPSRAERSNGPQQLRADLRVVASLVKEGSRVLDLGCDDGSLLQLLIDQKGVTARGVEITYEGVLACVGRGIPVDHADLDRGLGDYPDRSFDYVILSQTLQETRQPLKVLTDILRVGRRAIVAFPNFGHWRVRVAHLASGRAPRTDLFPHEWYASPNIHFLTVLDFEELARRENWAIERRIFLAGHREVAMLPNLLAEVAVFLIRK